MEKIEYKNFEIKSVSFDKDNNECIIEGYAASYGTEDSPQLTWIPDIQDWAIASDVLSKGCSKKTILERKGRIAFCKNHDIDDAKGKIIELKEDDNGLFCRIRISDAEPELKTKIREEIYTEFSIGFSVIKASFDKKNDGTYIRNVQEIKLYEISIVTIARNENAKITDIKSIDLNAIDTLVESLIQKEKIQEKKYQLLQLKSLIHNEPSISLKENKSKDKAIDFESLTFLN